MLGPAIVVATLVSEPLGWHLPFGVYGQRALFDVAAIVAIVVYVRLRHGTLADLIGQRRFRATDVLVGVLVGALAFAAARWINVWVTRELLGYTPRSGITMPSSWAAAAVQVTGLTVLGPLGEELAFRSYAYLGARKHLGPVVAALASAAVFAAIHAPDRLLIPLSRPGQLRGAVGVGLVFAYGLVFAWVFERRNLWASFTAHATANGLAVLGPL